MTDYKNVIESFNIVRGYSMIYQTKSNEIEYISKDDMSKKTFDKITFSKHNFKLHWLEKDISKFNKAVLQVLRNKEKYKHDGLIYVISSHGRRGDVVIESDGSKSIVSNIPSI